MSGLLQVTLSVAMHRTMMNDVDTIIRFTLHLFLVESNPLCAGIFASTALWLYAYCLLSNPQVHPAEVTCPNERLFVRWLHSQQQQAVPTLPQNLFSRKYAVTAVSQTGKDLKTEEEEEEQ